MSNEAVDPEYHLWRDLLFQDRFDGKVMVIHGTKPGHFDKIRETFGEHEVANFNAALIDTLKVDAIEGRVWRLSRGIYVTIAEQATPRDWVFKYQGRDISLRSRVFPVQ